MFKLVNQTEDHDFYHDPESNLFNLLPKGMPCGIAGYKYVKWIMVQKGYCKPWDGEIKARILFYGRG